MLEYNIIVILIMQVLMPMSWCLDTSCEQKLTNCTETMQPILNEVRYMFPTNQQEIEAMCKMWSHIMECIRKYMMECATDEQRTKFNDAVSNSIDSVHAICSSERYRRDYLENAACFKTVSMDSCGKYFHKMIDSAYNPQSMEFHICCAYGQYEKCVSEPIQRMCGPQTLQLFDHSMASLKSRCEAITHSRSKSRGSGCPASDNLAPGLVSASHMVPQKPKASTFRSLSTSAYLVNHPPFTTPSWTPRTVIYPLPPTQHSRIARNSTSHLLATNYVGIAISLVLIMVFRAT